MKKIILLVLAFLFSAQAEITQKQLEEYMKVSLAGTVLYVAQENLLSHALELNNIKLDHLSKSQATNIRDLIIHSFNDPEYISLFTKEFMKMSEKTYQEIMEFYTTEIGRKYRKVFLTFKGVKDSTDYRFRAFVKELIQNPFTKKKEALILKIMNSLDGVNIAISNTIEFDVVKYNMFKKYNLISKKEDLNISKLEHLYRSPDKIKLIKYLYFWDFSNFNEKELSKILNYISTNSGKMEFLLVSKGYADYRVRITEDIVDTYVKGLRPVK